MKEKIYKKVFLLSDMTQETGMELARSMEFLKAALIRIDLGENSEHPTTREWLLENGAEISDEFAYILSR